MSKWITDRKPTTDDGTYVYGPDGGLEPWEMIAEGEAWKPVPKIEAYEKPAPWSKVEWSEQHDCWTVHYPPNQCQILLDFHDRDSKKQREAAERIGKIYEEIFEELRRWNG